MTGQTDGQTPDRDQLQNPTLGNRVRATFTFTQWQKWTEGSGGTTLLLYFAFALMHDSRGIEIVNFTISLALSSGTLMASAGTPHRLVPAHFYPCIYLFCSAYYATVSMTSLFGCQLAREQSRLFAMMDHLRMKPTERSNGSSPPKTIRSESPPPPMNLSSTHGKVCAFYISLFLLRHRVGVMRC